MTKALKKYRQLARMILSRTPSTRWPCHECDRSSNDEPLRVLEIRVNGKVHWGGCTACNNDDLVALAREAVEEDVNHL